MIFNSEKMMLILTAIILQKLIFITCHTLQSVNDLTYENDERQKFQCYNIPKLKINAITKLDKQAFIFYDDIYVASTKIDDNKVIGEVGGIDLLKNFIPNINGQIVAAFSYDNITYFINQNNDVWQHKDHIISGPKPASQIFACIQQDYSINAILIHQSRYNSQMLIYHHENTSQFLTFCDMKKQTILEKYKREYKTDAIEAFYKKKEMYFHGISVHGYFFNFFQIYSIKGHMRYTPIIEMPYDNQILLGCPQHVCVNGKIDAIVKGFAGTSYMFIGKHFWEFKTLHHHHTIITVHDAKRIRKYWNKLPEFIDTAFNDENFIYFLKDESFYKYKITDSYDLIEVGSIENQFKGVPSFIDASWFNKFENNIYFFKENKIFVYNKHEKIVKMTGNLIIDGNKNIYFDFPQSNIDAIYDDGEKIYLFYQNYFYTMNLAKLESSIYNLTNKITQEHFFPCKNHYNYSETRIYRNFQNFKENLRIYNPGNLIFKIHTLTKEKQFAIYDKEKVNKINKIDDDLIEKWEKSFVPYFIEEFENQQITTREEKTLFLFMLFTTLLICMIICTLFMTYTVRRYYKKKVDKQQNNHIEFPKNITKDEIFVCQLRDNSYYN